MSRNYYWLILLIVLPVCLNAGLWAQQNAGAGSGTATQSSPSPSPATSTAPAAEVAQPNSFLLGQWKIERAIFEYFGNMKEVTGIDERFFIQLDFTAAGKGKARYSTKQDTSDMEWDLKDGQNLTLAFGSRLKPQVDLYKLLPLGDGAIFLRSTRLANANGTIIYLLRKLN